MYHKEPSIMERQRRTFEVVRKGGGDGKLTNDRSLLQKDLRKLKNCQVTGNRLQINHVFGCVGFPRFLVNLKTKATGRLVDSIVKNSLGPLCDARPVQTQKPGEKFVPARNTKKRGYNAVRKTGEATIEREAKFVFGKSSGTAFLLGRETEIVTFEFTQADGLVLVRTEERQDTDERDSGAEAKDEDEVEVDVGSDDDFRGEGNVSSIKAESIPVGAEITLSTTGHTSTSIVHYPASPEITPETAEGPIAFAASAVRCRGGGGGNDNFRITLGNKGFEAGEETPQRLPPSLSKETLTWRLPTPSTPGESVLVSHPPVRPPSIETPTWASADGNTGAKSVVQGGRRVHSVHNRVFGGGSAVAHQPESHGTSQESERPYDRAGTSPKGSGSAVLADCDEYRRDDSKFGGGPPAAPDGKHEEGERPYDVSGVSYRSTKPAVQHDRNGAFGGDAAASSQPALNGKREDTHRPHDEASAGWEPTVQHDRSGNRLDLALGRGAGTTSQPAPAHEDTRPSHKQSSAGWKLAVPGVRGGDPHSDLAFGGGPTVSPQPAPNGRRENTHRSQNRSNASWKTAAPGDRSDNRHDDSVFGGDAAASPQPAPNGCGEELHRPHDASTGGTHTVALPTAQGGRTPSRRPDPVLSGGKATTPQQSLVERYGQDGRQRNASVDGHTVANSSTKSGYGRQTAAALQTALEEKNKGRNSPNDAPTDARTTVQLVQRGGNGYRPHIQVFSRDDAVGPPPVAERGFDNSDRVLDGSGNSLSVAKLVAGGGRHKYTQQGEALSRGKALAPQSTSNRSCEGSGHPKYASRNSGIAATLAVQGHSGRYRPHDKVGGSDAVAPLSARDTSHEERYNPNGASGTGGMVPPPQVQRRGSVYRPSNRAYGGGGAATPQPGLNDSTRESPQQQRQEEANQPYPFFYSDRSARKNVSCIAHGKTRTAELVHRTNETGTFRSEGERDAAQKIARADQGLEKTTRSTMLPMRRVDVGDIDEFNRQTNMVQGSSVQFASHKSPCADDGSTKSTHGAGSTRARTLHKQTLPDHGNTTLEARCQAVEGRNDDELAAEVANKVRINDRSSNRLVDESVAGAEMSLGATRRRLTIPAATAITDTQWRSPMSHQAPAPCYHRRWQSSVGGSEAGSRTGWEESENTRGVPMTVRTKGNSGIGFPERRPSDDMLGPPPRTRRPQVILEPNWGYRVKSDGCIGTRWERGGIKRGASEMRGIGIGNRDSVTGRPQEKVTQATAAEVLQHRLTFEDLLSVLLAPAAPGIGRSTGVVSGTQGWASSKVDALRYSTHTFVDEMFDTHNDDPIQFDDRRTSLTKVLKLLGFELEHQLDELDQEPDGKRSFPPRRSGRQGFHYVTWRGTSAMSFQDRKGEFHESLQQIPIRLRYFLSSLMASATQNNRDPEHSDIGRLEHDLEERELLELARQELRQSVMRETLTNRSAGTEGEHTDTEAAVAATLVALRRATA